MKTLLRFLFLTSGIMLNQICEAQVPFNDKWQDAIPLFCGDDAEVGTTLGATLDTVPSDCGSAITNPGVWYKYSGYENRIGVSTCDSISPINTVLHLFKLNQAGDSLICCSFNDDPLTGGICGDRRASEMCCLGRNCQGVASMFILVTESGTPQGLQFKIEIDCELCLDDDAPLVSTPVATGDHGSFDLTSLGIAGSMDFTWIPSGFPPGLPSLPDVGYPGVFPMPGLVPGSIYDFYYRTNCGNGDASPWFGPTPFTANFECSITPPGNTLSTANPVSANESYTLSFENTGNTSGQTYQWQSSPDGVTWNNTPGATNPTLELCCPIFPEFERCMVVCTGSGETEYSNPILIQPVGGCTNTSACNYNSQAAIDDGSCIPIPIDVVMFDTAGDGWNGAVLDIFNDADVLVATTSLSAGLYNHNSFCLPSGNYSVTVGVDQQPTEVSYLIRYAANPNQNLNPVTYNPNDSILVFGTSHDYQVFSIGGARGCTNPLAINFNPSASLDDGSCYTTPAGDCNSLTIDGSGLYHIYKGQQPIVPNRGEKLNCDERLGVGSYTVLVCPEMETTSTFHLDNYLDAHTATSGNQCVCYVITVNSDGTCTKSKVNWGGQFRYGCTDPTANNYDPLANVDDGSCTYNVAPIPLITGPAVKPCELTTAHYSIAPVQYATSYNWTCPPGVVITVGQGTEAIDVSFPISFSLGDICVSAFNATSNTQLCLQVTGTPASTWYMDADEDGFGSSASSVVACAQPLGYVATNTDCNDANPLRNPLAVEICSNGIDENCNGQIDEDCGSSIPNDAPASGSNVAYSSNMNFPNCYPILGNTSNATDSPESALFSGPDTWYKFVAQSTAVSITMSSVSMDDAISLYSKTGLTYTLLDVENSSAGLGDFERLNYSGLAIGQTYYVSAGAVSGASAGAFSLCIQNLMPSSSAYAIPINGFPLCNNYKAVYRGSPDMGVTYTFNFTGTGGGASGTTSLGGTNGLISLANPSLALRYGGIYNVSVDVTYTLANSAGSMEILQVIGSAANANGTGVLIANQPLLEVKLSQRCPAILLRSNYLIGTPVAGYTNACGAISYSYQFTQVVSCSDNTTISSLPIVYTTLTNSPYLNLGNLANLTNNGAWSVRIRPEFSYGNGVYGPARIISVNNTAAAATLPEANLLDDAERVLSVRPEASIYPNPNNGQTLNVHLEGLTKGPVFIVITDAIGHIVFQDLKYSDGILNSVVTFNQSLATGIYHVEFRINGDIITERLLIE